MSLLQVIRNRIRENKGVNLSIAIKETKPRIKAGFRTENGFTYLYINSKVAGYRTPEYVYFKGKKIFT